MQTTEDKRANQVKSLLLSPYAILKLIGFALIWQTIGLSLAFVFNFGIFIIFIAFFFAVLWLFPYWQPAYSIIYRIIGNNNIPPNLEKYQFRSEWWHFIPLGIKLAFLLYIFYIGIKIWIQ